MTASAPPPRLPAPSFVPVLTLLDDVALVEHASFDVPDPSCGHCTDDAGRALALAAANPRLEGAERLAVPCVRFLGEMHLGGGRFRVRDVARHGVDVTSDDAAGRAIQGLGVAAAMAPWPAVRDAARRLFAAVVDFASPHLRSRAHAALGACALVAAGDAPRGTLELLDRCVAGLDDEASDTWPWPEPRLTYGNALIVDACLADAALRRDLAALERALRTLRWLADIEMRPGHFSPTPVGGWAAGEPRPAFDQQPIEAWAFAEAAGRALHVTGDPTWAAAVHAAADWFAGANDTGTTMWDRDTGRAYDGLQAVGVNRNEGAESTLALVASTIARTRAGDDRQSSGVGGRLAAAASTDRDESTGAAARRSRS